MREAVADRLVEWRFASCGGENGNGAAEIVGAAGEHDVYPVFGQREEAHAAQAVMLLEHGKWPLHGRAHTADQPVAAFVARGQVRMMLVGPVHQAVLDASRGETSVPGMGRVSLIAIDRPLVAADQAIGAFSVGDRGIGQFDAADDRVILIRADVYLVAKHTLVALAAPARLGVASGFDGALRARGLACGTRRSG